MFSHASRCYRGVLLRLLLLMFVSLVARTAAKQKSHRPSKERRWSSTSSLPGPALLFLSLLTLFSNSKTGSTLPSSGPPLFSSSFLSYSIYAREGIGDLRHTAIANSLSRPLKSRTPSFYSRVPWPFSNIGRTHQGKQNGAKYSFPPPRT